jgi:hypothetical protein
MPWFVIPRQTAPSSVAQIRCARPSSVPPLPHAATTRSDSLAARFSHWLARFPTGSVAILSAWGFVARKAKRFTSRSEPYPHSFAKPTHRLSVGSSSWAVAVDGLSPMKAHCPPDGFQLLRNQ